MQDVETLLKFYQSGKRDGGFEGGIELALERILASPKFLFRVERDPATRLPAAAIASAISNWPRGFRSFCGAAFPMTSCSGWRAKAS